MIPTRIAILTLGVFVSVAGGCAEPVEPVEPGDRPTTDVPPRNTAPVAHTGSDLLVGIPGSALLNGSAGDAEDNVESYSWRRVSGPDLFTLESPSSMTTKVTSLQRGLYEFELMVRDRGWLTDTDTVAVIVYDPLVRSENEVVYRNLHWGCPMGCSVDVANIRAIVSSGVSISVFLQHSDNSEWIEVPHSTGWTPQTKYVWDLYNFGLSVYTDDEAGAVNVKVVF